MNKLLPFYLGFSIVNGIGPIRLERLLAYFGAVDQAWNADLSDLLAAGLERRWATELIKARRTLDLDAEIERANKLQIQLICREDSAYPAALVHIPAPPPLLYVRGQLTAADTYGVAMVGTRSPSAYGREATRLLATEFAEAGVTVISGLAIGIDSIAHSSALEANGRSIAVLPCGIDLVYPERHTKLAEAIRASGALVSEFPIGIRPIPQLFPVRNRLISGLAKAVLVVEARQGSGALITVDYALEQGRDVFAVPGPIYNQTSEGPHQLLRNGAGLATCAADILETFGGIDPITIQVTRETLPIEPAEQELLNWLSREPTHIDQLCRMSSWPIEQLSATLALLELKGFVRQAGPMEYVRL